MVPMQIQKPILVQRQELRMTPQLLQSIKIMSLPMQELQTRIQEELEINPALEVREERQTVSLDENTGPGEEYEYFENSSDPGYTTVIRARDEGEGLRGFLEGVLSRPESLHEHLRWQLRLQPITAEEFAVGELVINNLDDNGFHREDPMTLVDLSRHQMLQRMIMVIQTFEPVGTAVADFRESLIVQAMQSPVMPEGTVPIIRNHLEDLEKGRHREIARAVGIPQPEVDTVREFIRTLNPFPGRMFAPNESQYVVPDLILTQREGQFVLILNDEEIPVLGVNDLFTHTTESADREARKFAQTRVKEARWFIQSIHQRNQTLLRVARAILDFQRDFFIKGRKYLVPLTLRDIAQEIDVSEATVSRITNGKYIQTEWGIFELKQLFSNSVAGTGANGSRYSKEGVKERVREILEEYGTTGKRLSDQKIADILAQRGIPIARRTVAKYRGELNISSSYER